jgi:hypothetical protein
MFAIWLIFTVYSPTVKNWHASYRKSKSGLCSLLLPEGSNFNKLSKSEGF